MNNKNCLFHFNGGEFKSAEAAWESVRTEPGVISLSTFLKRKPSTLTEAKNNRKHGYMFNGAYFSSITDAWESIGNDPCRISFSTFYACKPKTLAEAIINTTTSSSKNIYAVIKKPGNKKYPSKGNFVAANKILQVLGHLTGLDESQQLLLDTAKLEIEKYNLRSGR